MAKDYTNKPMSEWTEEDFAAEAANSRAALEGVASQMEAELAESMRSHEPEETTEKTE